MAGTHDITQLVLSKPNGTGLTRIEAEKELWDKCKITHNIRLLASYHFGLENKYALGMTPTSVIHWVLDQMIRKHMIAGDQLDVQPELESDASYFNSYIQRLGVFVQNGEALMPKEGEGIDMSDFQHQMPPQQPQNGQQPGQPQGYIPPPPPPIGYPGQQMAPPQQPQYQQPPQGQPPQQFQQPPQQQFAGQPPQNFGPPPGMPQQQFQQPPQQQAFQQPPQPGFPPQGAPNPGIPPQQPGFPPAMPSQQQAAPQGAPPPPPAAAPSNRRRGKAEGAPAAAPQGMAPPQQQQMPFGGPQPQNGFSTPPQMPQFGGPNGAPAAVQQQAGNVGQVPSTGGRLEAQVEHLTQLVVSLTKQVGELTTYARHADAALSIILRPYYQKNLPTDPSQLNTEATFREIGLPIPS